MAEPPSKSKKLASARKKLREYQSQRKEQSATSPSLMQELVAENVSSVPFEKKSSQVNIDISDDSSNSVDPESASKLPVRNYFTDTKQSSGADNFFDNLAPVSAINILSDTKCDVKPMEPFVNIIHAEVENGAVVSDELINDANSEKAESASSTVDSSSDYTQKLSYSITAQDSIEQPSCSDISELERKNEELISTLTLEQKKYDDLFHQFSSYKQEMENVVDSLKNQNYNLKLDLCEMGSKIKMQLAALDMITSEKATAENEKENLTKQFNELKEQVKDLKSQLSNMDDVKNNSSLWEKKYKQLAEEESQHRQSVEVLEETNSLLTRNLQLKSAELEKLQQVVEANKSIISMLQMKINQMGGNVDMETVDKERKNLQDELLGSEDTIRKLKDKVQSLIFEKEQTNLNYQNWISTLNEEVKNSQLKVQELTQENASLRETLSMQINHISKLEMQLQRNNSEDSDEQTSSNAELDSEKNILIQKLKDDINILNEALQDRASREELLQRKLFSLENALEQYDSEKSNIELLQNAVESEKVAASQAMQQNAKLKKQYEELHDAFITLNNNKVELLQRIEEEKAISQRLSKELSKQLSDNSSKLKLQTSEAGINTDECSNENEDSSDNLMNMGAMVQLQERFKEVVNKMADLTDEKQQLEHLVTQLQSETETIGEYVTLYQKQRYLLNQKTQEKDQLIYQIMNEKGELYKQVMHLSAALQSISPDNANHAISNVKADYEPVVTSTSGAKDNDGVLHPTCCYCSGRRIITV